MPKMDLSKYGIKNVKEVLYNPTYEVLYNEETKPDHQRRCSWRGLVDNP